MLPADTVQPIVLLVDKETPASHADAVAAAALACVRSFATRRDDAAWEAWIAGRFTKTVRRANPKTFAKLAAAAHGGVSTVGRARAVAFEPVSYADMPRAVRSLQVSGTELPPDPPASVPEGAPVIVLNADLGMSTGKAAAQAAHALLAWYLQAVDHAGAGNSTDYRFPTAPAVPVAAAVIELPSARFAALAAEPGSGPLIVDAGLTEIDPGTATAFVRSAGLG